MCMGFPLGQTQTCQCSALFLATSRAQYRSGCCYECFSTLRPTDPRSASTTPKIKTPRGTVKVLVAA